MVKWVAKLTCGHITGGETQAAPVTETQALWCDSCKDGATAVEVISNTPLRHPVTQRAW